jgi:hypothetical protein
MKLLKKIQNEENEVGFAIVEDAKTKEVIIITMPAERFKRFFRKFSNQIGQRVEVANGWIYPATIKP